MDAQTHPQLSATMAPDSSELPEEQLPDLSNSLFHGFKAWVKACGVDEHAAYVKTKTDSSPLPYEEWSKSTVAEGTFVLKLTMALIPDSDDEEEEAVEAVQPKPSTTRRKRKSPAADPTDVNGSGPHAGSSSTNSAAANGVESTVPAKKQRKSRKSTKKLSEDTISKDDNDDHTTSSEIPATSLADPDAKAVTPGSKATKKTPKTAKKSTTPKSPLPSSHATTTAPDSEVATPTPATATNAASPNGSGSNSPAPSSATRTGLRVRNQVQQHPYLYHERIFEEQLAGTPAALDAKSTDSTKQRRKSKLARVSFPPVDELPSHAEPNGIPSEALLEDVENQPAVTGLSEKPEKKKTFKGKGRAWKKDSDDEDDDFIGEKGAKKTKEPKKRGRPAKEKVVRLSLTQKPQLQDPVAAVTEKDKYTASPSVVASKETVAEDETDSFLVEQTPQPTAERETPGGGTEKKQRRKPRRSHKSEEFVRDDSSDVDEDTKHQAEEDELPTVQTIQQHSAPLRDNTNPSLPRNPWERTHSQTPRSGTTASDTADGTPEPRKTPSPRPQAEKQRRRSSKPFKSSEFIADSSDNEDEDELPTFQPNPSAEPPAPSADILVLRPATPSPKKNQQPKAKKTPTASSAKGKKKGAKLLGSATKVKAKPNAKARANAKAQAKETEAQEKKRKRRARKPFRSSEFVQEDSSDHDMDVDMGNDDNDEVVENGSGDHESGNGANGTNPTPTQTPDSDPPVSNPRAPISIADSDTDTGSRDDESPRSKKRNPGPNYTYSEEPEDDKSPRSRMRDSNPNYDYSTPEIESIYVPSKKRNSPPNYTYSEEPEDDESPPSKKSRLSSHSPTKEIIEIPDSSEAQYAESDIEPLPSLRSIKKTPSRQSSSKGKGKTSTPRSSHQSEKKVSQLANGSATQDQDSGEDSLPVTPSRRRKTQQVGSSGRSPYVNGGET